METYYQLLKHHLDELKFNNFKNRLKKEKQAQKYSIDDVDMMDGKEFENFVALIFSKMGYQTEVTKASGDQGIDVIATKGDKKIGIQAKCYSSTVGNSAIQEAVAGKAFYKLDKVIVATNNFFTDSALQLAQANGVVLWDRNMLKEKITEVVN
jgi:HJR/Mrr/RecB family endonuclease